MTQLAQQVEGVRTVSGSTERDVIFPSPATGQKVYNQTTNFIERWSGSAWVPIGGGLRVFDVTHYGATGDGTTDDTAAIQSAIDAAGAGVVSGTTSGDGGVVYLPPGTYKISAMLVIGPHVRMMGAGMFSTLISSIYNGFAIKIGTDSAVNLSYGNEISNLAISAIGGTSAGGIWQKGTCGFRADNVIVEGSGNTNNAIGWYIDGGDVANIFSHLNNCEIKYFKTCVRLGSSGISTTTSVTAVGCNVFCGSSLPAGFVGISVDGGNGAQSRWIGGNIEFCPVGADISGFGMFFIGVRLEANTVDFRLNSGAAANTFMSCGGLNSVTDNSAQVSNRFYGNLQGDNSDWPDTLNALGAGLKFGKTSNTYRSELARNAGAVAIANGTSVTVDVGRDVALVMIYEGGVTTNSALVMVNLLTATAKIVSQSAASFTEVLTTNSKVNVGITGGAFKVENKLGSATTIEWVILRLHIN